MEGFTAAELDDLFMALVLHAKSTREEQTAWVKDRAEIWSKLVSLTTTPDAYNVTFRTHLFESEEELQKLWKSPDLMEKVFTKVKKKTAKTAP